MLGKATHMQSLKTTVKREAERLSRSVSVQFDAICHEARLKHEAAIVGETLAKSEGNASQEVHADAVLARIPELVRQAASRVIEEQKRNPKDWLNVVKGWQSFYEAMKAGTVPREAQRPAIEAQAFLNGIDLVIQGKPLPVYVSDAGESNTPGLVRESGEPWGSVCRHALSVYRDRVGDARYKLAEKCLPEVKVLSNSLSHVEAGLLDWCRRRLNEVSPRTVKTQLDCMVSALRCVLPKLQVPRLRELQGVMQPRTDDRQSMPVQAIRAAINGFKNVPRPKTVRTDFAGGASQFDDVAITALAFLGLRPRELFSATTSAIVEKQDVFGTAGIYFCVAQGKNKSAERAIPIADDGAAILDVKRLIAMLDWQDKNPRSPHGAVTSFSTRFGRMTNGYTPYQMRHAWKDIAVHGGVDFELRERILGHRVKGVAAVYGSGIPLRQGLEALAKVKQAIMKCE